MILLSRKYLYNHTIYVYIDTYYLGINSHERYQEESALKTKVGEKDGRISVLFHIISALLALPHLVLKLGYQNSLCVQNQHGDCVGF